MLDKVLKNHVEQTIGEIVRNIYKGERSSVYEIIKKDGSEAAVKIIKIIDDPFYSRKDDNESQADKAEKEKKKIKRLTPEFERIKKEAEYLTELDSEYTVRYLSEQSGTIRSITVNDTKNYLLGAAKGDFEGYFVMIVMERLYRMKENMDLAGNEDNVLKFAIDIANAISEIHGKGVMHRDIKPENIFYTYVNGEIIYKLGDFGLSINGDNAHSIAGTGKYIAPEIADMSLGGYDPRIDIYSFGICLYELLSQVGVPTESVLIIGVGSVDIAKHPLPQLIGVSPEFASIIYKACAKDPNERYQNINDMKADLEKLKNGTYSIPLVTATFRADGTRPAGEKKAGLNEESGINEVEKYNSPPSEKTGGTSQNRSYVKVAGVIFMIAAVIGIAAFLNNRTDDEDIAMETTSSTQPAVTEVLAVNSDVNPVAVTTVPETTVAETTAPETTIAETTALETTVAETTAPETTVAVTTAPETTVAVTTTPETTTATTTVPETTVAATTTSRTTTTVKTTKTPKVTTKIASSNKLNLSIDSIKSFHEPFTVNGNDADIVVDMDSGYRGTYSFSRELTSTEKNSFQHSARLFDKEGNEYNVSSQVFVNGTYAFETPFWLEPGKYIYTLDIFINDVCYSASTEFYFENNTSTALTPLTPVMKNGLWGYIDAEKNIVIDYQYEMAGEFSEGLANVSNGEYFGFIDEDNNIVIPFQYLGAMWFVDGRAAVYYQNKWGFIDKNNNLIVPYTYSDISIMWGGDGNEYYADENGTPIKFD